jgi:hypothetical protein
MTGYEGLYKNTDEKQISLADKLNSGKTGFLLKQVISKLFDMHLIGIVLNRVLGYFWQDRHKHKKTFHTVP